MEFIKSEDNSELETALQNALDTALDENKMVLWLVPGGSNKKTAIEVMARLDQQKLSKLTIMLTDERFGPKGHADSNYHQLATEGFNVGKAQFEDILSNGTVQEVTRSYGELAKKNFDKADVVIGFFGMGTDGHTAGILPHSSACTAGNVWADNYEASPLIRVTLTPFALSHVDKAFVGAFGDEKHDPLATLRDKILPVAVQPIQLMRHIPKVVIYSNQIEDLFAKLPNNKSGKIASVSKIRLKNNESLGG